MEVRHPHSPKKSGTAKSPPLPSTHPFLPRLSEKKALMGKHLTGTLGERPPSHKKQGTFSAPVCFVGTSPLPWGATRTMFQTFTLGCHLICTEPLMKAIHEGEGGWEKSSQINHHPLMVLMVPPKTCESFFWAPRAPRLCAKCNETFLTVFCLYPTLDLGCHQSVIASVFLEGCVCVCVWEEMRGR